MRTCIDRLILAALLAAAGLLLGCSNPVRVSSPVEDTGDFLEQGSRPKPAPVMPPEEVESALLPPIQVDIGPEKARDGQRFDINVSQVPAREFFMGLVEGTHYNMVVQPQVEGTITLKLKRVTIPEVMEIARSAYGYEFQQTSYGFQVLPARIRSRLFYVNYLHVLRSGSSQTRVSSGQISQSASRGRQSDDGEDSGDSQRARRQVTGTEINTLRPQTTFWTELETSIRAILGSAPGRSVVVNPQSGVIVVRAMPGELREIEAYLRATDAIAGRQVILEAKILEVELSDGYQTGIDWTVLLDLKGNSNELEFSGRPFGGIDAQDITDIVNRVIKPFGGIFSISLSTGDVDALIDLLQTQGNVQVLSSPRVSTLNNQQAVIKVGSDEFFVTDISSTTVTGVATTTSPNVELTPFFSGIALDVTPQISADGTVTLHIHPSVSNVRDQEKEIAIGGSTPNIRVPLAFSTVRESDSVVRARSGQVVVIGGLMTNDVVDDRSAPPVLGDIPALGRLFRQERGASRKSELVILLRPMVVDDGSAWTQDIGQSRRSFEGLERGIQESQKEPQWW